MHDRQTLAAALCLMLALGFALPASGAKRPFAEVPLAPTPLAVNAGLENASGTANVHVQKGTVFVVVDLGAVLPAGSVLEGWVVDAGLQGGPGGPGASSVSDADEVFGPPFGDPALDALVDDAPYALSTGVLKRLGNGTYKGKFSFDNSLKPYDAVVITLESDANRGDYDPRPGTPVLAGEL